MMRELLPSLFGFLFAIVIITVLVEIALAATWNRFYFTKELSILKYRVAATPYRREPPTTGDLEPQFQSSDAAPLVFGRLSANRYGFREKLVSFSFLRYTPVVHGLLVFDYAHREVVVQGFANWAVTLFSLYWYTALIAGADPSAIYLIASGDPHVLLVLLFVIAPVLLMGILYAIQFYRYRQVAIRSAEMWSRLR